MYPDPSVTDRLPPHNRDAERSLLGSMLRDNAVIGDVIQVHLVEHQPGSLRRLVVAVDAVFVQQRSLRGSRHRSRRRPLKRPPAGSTATNPRATNNEVL